jgi:hypothetical protein
LPLGSAPCKLRELLDGLAELKDAWAVFADAAAVANPEEEVGLGGGSNNVGNGHSLVLSSLDVTRSGK